MSAKIKAILVLGAMFGLGVISGLVLQKHQDHGGFKRHGFFAERRIKKLKTQLNLSPAQEQAVRVIFQKAHERATQVNEEVAQDLGEIHRDSVQAIQSVLTPDQRQRFENLHREYHVHHNYMPDDFCVSTGSAKVKS